jgi:pimeloyl-ACP methyl ester carboxylesterase
MSVDLLMLLAGASGFGAYAYTRPTDLYRRALTAHLRLRGLRPARARLPRAAVEYWTGGRGMPVLFVHGFGTEAVINWAAQLPAARRHFRVVAPDLPGFGRSERVASDAAIALHVECLRDLLDHLGIDRTHVVGHSMGGWISLAFAAAYPERVDRLCVVDAAGLRFDPDMTLQRVLLPETAADVAGLVAANFQRPPWLPRFVLRDVLRVCRREAPTRTELLRQLVHGNEFLDEALAHICAPTLIAWGRSDVITPLALGERLAAGIRDAELVVFDDCAHSPNVERPRRFNALLFDFLRGVRADTRGDRAALAATG